MGPGAIEHRPQLDCDCTRERFSIVWLMFFEFYADLIDYTRWGGIHSPNYGPARYLRLRIGTDSGKRPTDGRNRHLESSGSGTSSIDSKAGVRHCQYYRGFPVQCEELPAFTFPSTTLTSNSSHSASAVEGGRSILMGCTILRKNRCVDRGPAVGGLRGWGDWAQLVTLEE